jgi:NAD(P)-dependent dehydrogenase (short-subunit alcohol dehydrogenase family)
MTTILITGAGSGIGAATARMLAGQGVEVVAGLAPGEDAAAWRDVAHVTPLELDVTDAGSIAGAFRAIDGRLGGAGLDGLVDNAGIGVAGPLEVLPIDRLRATLETNVIGQVAVTQAALPLLRRAPARAGGRARIVLVGSVGGRLASQFAGAYHASKFAIEAIADVWRQELEPDAIHVALVEPAAVSTPIWDKAIAGLDELLGAGAPPAIDRYRERLAAFRETLRGADEHGMDPDKVAEVIAQALLEDKPDTRYVVGGAGRLATALRPLIPDRLADRLGERTAS